VVSVVISGRLIKGTIGEEQFLISLIFPQNAGVGGAFIMDKPERFADDLPQILVPHVKLGFRHFLFLNSGTPLALEDGNSKNCAA